jgi:hypothetical protein
MRGSQESHFSHQRHQSRSGTAFRIICITLLVAPAAPEITPPSVFANRPAPSVIGEQRVAFRGAFFSATPENSFFVFLVE